MNNAQFRKLVLDTPARSTTSPANSTDKPLTKHNATITTLGSKLRSSIPMTPRSVTTVDFAHQLAEKSNPSHPTKKFRSSTAPKGAKLPSGYRDRTQDRVSADEDDKAARVKALEELWKLDQIDRPTFEKLRDEIVGGDVGSTHLVKGLDFRLLERVRGGEDVLGFGGGKGEGMGEGLEEELDKLADREIKPIEKEKVAKKGSMAPPPAVTGKKRTRDEILADLKAQREAAKKQQVQSTLGPKFRKIGEPREKTRVERDERGREVLITVDAEGRVKRKVKKPATAAIVVTGEGVGGKGMLLMPEKGAKRLGMEVPEVLGKTPVQEEEEDIDIFEGVGGEYNPFGELGGEEDDDDSDSDSDASSTPETGAKDPAEKNSPVDQTTEDLSPPQPSPHRSQDPPAPRNYFPTPSSSTTTNEPTPSNPLTDPTILAALRKASSLHPLSLSSTDPEVAAKEARRKKMLEAEDRDAEDMDFGFGSSRFADGEEEDEEGGGKKVRLSEWGGVGGGETGGKMGGGGRKERKRGGKKRKGDAGSAKDVLAVLERRKEGGK